MVLEAPLSNTTEEIRKQQQKEKQGIIIYSTTSLLIHVRSGLSLGLVGGLFYLILSLMGVTTYPISGFDLFVTFVGTTSPI